MERQVVITLDKSDLSVVRDLIYVLDLHMDMLRSRGMPCDMGLIDVKAFLTRIDEEV